ncbi:MAG: hypothetical protein RLZZ519_2304 [Bacteroidota bacterium]
MAKEDRDYSYEDLAAGKLAIAKNADLLGYMAGTARGNAGIAACNELGPDEILKDLKLASSLATTHWSMASGVVDEAEIEIVGHHYHVSPKKSTAFISIADWKVAVYVELILRSKANLQLLSHAAKLVFKQENPIHESAGELEWMLLQAIAEGDDVLAKTEASKLPSLVEVGKELFAKLIQGPQSLVWYAIFCQDQSNFDMAVLAALQSHKEFWGNTSNSQKEYGWISFPLLAACAYAHDHGMDLNVESDYIPRWLVTGDFL